VQTIGSILWAQPEHAQDMEALLYGMLTTTTVQVSAIFQSSVDGQSPQSNSTKVIFPCAASVLMKIGTHE